MAQEHVKLGNCKKVPFRCNMELLKVCAEFPTKKTQ